MATTTTTPPSPPQTKPEADLPGTTDTSAGDALGIHGRASGAYALNVDADRKVARVQPGVVCDQLKEETHKHRLELPSDPATHAWCTLGGMIGNDSCGPHSLMSDKTGRTVDHVEELEVLTYDGLRLR